MYLLALLCSLPALYKTMCPCKSASSGSVSVAKESSSDTLVCVNNSKGGRGGDICAFLSTMQICYICLHVCIQYNFTFVPACLLYVQIHGYMHRPHLNGWNLCSCIMIGQLSNGRVSIMRSSDILNILVK